MQTSYQDQSAVPAMEGGLYDTGWQDVITRSPGGNQTQVDTLSMTTDIAAVAQVDKITITTAADGDNFTVYINGVLVASGVSAGTDKTVQRDALQALLIANAYFAANFTWADSSTDAGTITAIHPGVGFSIDPIVIDATSVWTPTTVTPNTVGTTVHLDLNGYSVYFPCASTTEQTERDALLVILEADNHFTSVLDMAATGSGPYNIVFTALVSGVPFTLTMVNENTAGAVGSGTVALTHTTLNITGAPIPFGRVVARIAASPEVISLPSVTGFVVEGVSVNRAKARPRDNTGATPVTGHAQYNGDDPVPVLRKGRIWVIPETSAASLASSVYVRHTQGASASLTPGRVRGTDDSGKVDAFSGARWIQGPTPNALPTAGELAVIEFNLP